MKVRARSGRVFDMPDHVATALVRARGNGYEFVKEPVVVSPASEAPKRRPRKKAAKPKEE